MRKVVDDVVLLMFASVSVFLEPDLIRPVIALLIGMITAALGIYIADKKWFTIIGIIFVLLCFLLPQLTFFLPILFYHGYFYKAAWALSGILPFLLACREFTTTQVIFWCILCGTGILLAYQTLRIETLEKEMIRMRDTSTELNMILREKNKNLMDKQDYEIYLATLRERNRIAREIHDNVGHMLSRSILQVGALATIQKEEPLHGQLLSINDTLNFAMNNIRESVHDLHDDSVDLKQAVIEATRELQAKYKVKIDYDMTQNVPRKVKYCFITTIKEAMSNVVKHSNAEKVEIVLREHPAFYQLSVEDNGTNMPKNLEGGIGLGNMKERTDALGGTIHIHAENGFKIFISIPKHADKE